MSTILGTFVLNVQYIRPQYSVHLSPTFGTFFDCFWPLIININACFLYLSLLQRLLSVVSLYPSILFPTSRYRNHYIPEIKVPTSRYNLYPKAWDVCSKSWDVCFETWDINLYEERETFISGERNYIIETKKNMSFPCRESKER